MVHRIGKPANVACISEATKVTTIMLLFFFVKYLILGTSQKSWRKMERWKGFREQKINGVSKAQPTILRMPRLTCIQTAVSASALQDSYLGQIASRWWTGFSPTCWSTAWRFSDDCRSCSSRGRECGGDQAPDKSIARCWGRGPPDLKTQTCQRELNFYRHLAHSPNLKPYAQMGSSLMSNHFFRQGS